MNTTTPTKLTQCPHCQSVFDVSKEELQLALGAVRCGDCMKIFNASYHLIDVPKNHLEQEPNLAQEETAQNLENNHLQQTAIPTLQEHSPLSPLSPYSLDDNANEEEDNFLYLDKLPTTDKPNAQQIDTEPEPKQLASSSPTKKLTPPIIAGLFILLASLLIGSWLVTNQTTAKYYEFSEVRLTPSSNPKKMDVHFKLTNISQQKLTLPNLTIQLLNLSSQPISSEIINTRDFKTNLNELEAGTSQAITVSVNRPSTFVQSAHIQEYFEDSKL